ncbi:sulfatase-like hydrolase/transferase [Flavobacterium sp. NG2]|uniref:sulfatase-like hydrolase/transferase n=1 Tax=Flavobacterium sp. NG2 TaxID=3097547 RepID=UPI002A83E977|nr:sulfatase-like hydrolase/transferase [Flavobacterium sp. NG2]WPR71262.1 sulfatase-like hydrolase/transferase [Flavobacterium sp. NG2]
MKIKDQLKNSFSYLYLSLSLILTFWLISLFEIVSKTINGIQLDNTIITILYKLLNDIWTGLVISLLFYPLYLVLGFAKKPWDSIVVKVFFSLIVIGQFALTKYHLTTLVNLGADFLGYSIDDMFTTVTASESLSIVYFIPFIVFPILYLGIHKAISTSITTKQLYITFGSLALVSFGFKTIVSEFSDSNYQNKLAYFTSDIIRFQTDKNAFNADNLTYKKEYPLVKSFNETPDVLSPFFEIKEEKPNIVMIIVEGLGNEFIGKNEYRGFTPYLDSLIPKSLYWENFVSNAGRTFGALPSILGSLPYGEKGFLEMNPLPSHISLVSILKANEYTTSFYCGDESSFDRKINFLEYNGIDNVIDINKFGPGYEKTKENSGGFSWGYPDGEIFKKTLSELDGKKAPRLDIIMTLTNHEPFDFPAKKEYLKKVDSIMNTNKTLAVSKSEVATYKDIFACLLYTDHSIKNFIESYKKRPEYKNTIFVITGDHRLIPIAQKDKLCRFHVPLYMYSPLLKKTQTFKSVSSHWDIAPSLISFLMNNYKMNKMEKTTWMSTGLDTVKKFRNIHTIPIMQNKGSINELIYKDYLYSDGNLFKIDENFTLSKIKDSEMMKIIEDTLTESKKLNAYLTQKNKIIPNSINIYTKPAFQFSKEDLATIKKLTKGLTYDETFFLARDFAFNNDRQKARLLCNYILNEFPNYADVRTLKGRTLAWDKDYKKAESELLEVVKRTPFYNDSYIALMDLYWWSSQDAKGISIAKKGLKNKVENPELGIKLAQAYKRTNNIKMANATIDSILKKHPGNKEFIKIKNAL